jgi:hypothetical protein
VAAEFHRINVCSVLQESSPQSFRATGEKSFFVCALMISRCSVKMTRAAIIVHFG